MKVEFSYKVISLIGLPDLAVIFRPALLSHPTHELSPTEHQLSQDVLEFLIEHQDWFMLEITSNATGNTGAPSSSSAGNSQLVMKTDDEWTADGSRRVTRRRTTSERPGGEFVSRPRHVLHKRRRMAEHTHHGRSRSGSYAGRSG